MSTATRTRRTRKLKIFPFQFSSMCCAIVWPLQSEKQQTDDEAHTLSSPLWPRTLTIEVRHGRQVISAHYVAHLCEVNTAKEHRQFLQNKYKWTYQVWGSFAMKAFHFRARKLATDHPVTRSKIVQNAQIRSTGATTEIEECCCPYCRQPEHFTHDLLLTHQHWSESTRVLVWCQYTLGTAISKIGETGETLLAAIKVWTLPPQEIVTWYCPLVGWSCKRRCHRDDHAGANWVDELLLRVCSHGVGHCWCYKCGDQPQGWRAKQTV